MSRKILLSLALVGTLCAAGVLYATLSPQSGQPQPPVPKNDGHFSTARFEPGALPERETLTYELTWNGVACATFEVTTTAPDNPGPIRLQYHGKTLEVLDALWKYRIRGHTDIDRKTLLPDSTFWIERENEDREESTVEFDRDAGSARTVTREADESDPSVDTVEFTQGLDTSSLFLYLRHLSWETGATHTLEMVDEDERYILQLTAKGHERVEVPAGDRSALKVQMVVARPSGEGTDPEEEGPPARRLTLWLSDDEHRIPLLLHAPVFVGEVRARLLSASPRASSP